MKQIINLWKKGRMVLFLGKRQRFAVQTVILTAGLLITQLIWTDYRFLSVAVLSISAYILSIWSLSEDINGVERLLLFILPVFFTASVSLFYFLLPGRWLTRLITVTAFSVGTYAILLIENIYNVAAERSIQLLRAAHSVGLLITLVVIFLTANIIYSFRLTFILNLVVFIPIIYLVALQSFWSVKLEEKLTKKVIIYAGIASLAMGELALVLSFWPIANSAYSLLITASYYSLTGIIQQYFLDKLFKDAIREYILVFLFTLIVTFLITKWG